MKKFFFAKKVLLHPTNQKNVGLLCQTTGDAGLEKFERSKK